MSGAHKEIRDEGKERGIEAVDRREVGQEGKRHSWKEEGNICSCKMSQESLKDRAKIKT